MLHRLGVAEAVKLMELVVDTLLDLGLYLFVFYEVRA